MKRIVLMSIYAGILNSLPTLLHAGNRLIEKGRGDFQSNSSLINNGRVLFPEETPLSFVSPRISALSPFLSNDIKPLCAIICSNAVEYDDASWLSITLGDRKGGLTKLKNLDRGQSGTHEAINAIQLDETNQNVGWNRSEIGKLDNKVGGFDKRIDHNTTEIAKLDERVTENGKEVATLKKTIKELPAGLVEYDKEGGALKIAQDLDARFVDISGVKDGQSSARLLDGVAEGDLKEKSTQAVNGHQLNETNQAVKHNRIEIENLNGRVGGFDERIVDNTQSIQQLDGKMSGFDAQITGHATKIRELDGRVARNSQEIVKLKKKRNTSPGSPPAGTDLIYEDEETGAIDIARKLDSKSIDFSGTHSGSLNEEFFARILTGVDAGAIGKESKQAVNGSQLYAFQQQTHAWGEQMSNRVSNIEKILDSRKDTPQHDIPYHDHAALAHEEIHQKPSVSPGTGGLALGDGARVTGSKGTAIGSNARVSGDHAVAIGDGAVAERNQSFSVGSQGNERQITHVAAGTENTDAVNIKQLNEGLNHTVENAQHYADERFLAVRNEISSVGKAAYAGISAAMAMPNLTPSGPGRAIVAAGTGSYKSGHALAVGLTYRSHDMHWLLNSAVSVSSSRDIGWRAHIGYEF